MARVISVVNQKGGVGKTTTTINICSIIAMRGNKVLLIDIDPQGNSSLGLGIDKKNIETGIYSVLIGDSTADESLVKTAVEGLEVLPANINLAGAEVELVNIENRETRLKDALAEIKDRYDYVFIDCPPSLGLLTLNALTASDSVLIPIQCEFYALDGLAMLLETVENVREALNPDLTIEGALITMFDSRTSLSLQVVEEIKKKFKNRAYDTIIPRNVRLSEAPSFGTPINLYDKHSKGAQAYEKLCDEILGVKRK